MVWFYTEGLVLLSESARPPCLSDGEGHSCGLGLQGDAHDGGTATSVQPRSTHHHVPHPRVQMVSHAPEAAHWPAVCTGEWRSRLEEVCEVLYEREGGHGWCLQRCSDLSSTSQVSYHFIAVWKLLLNVAFIICSLWIFKFNYSKTDLICVMFKMLVNIKISFFAPLLSLQPLHQICHGLC